MAETSPKKKRGCLGCGLLAVVLVIVGGGVALAVAVVLVLLAGTGVFFLAASEPVALQIDDGSETMGVEAVAPPEADGVADADTDTDEAGTADADTDTDTTAEPTEVEAPPTTTTQPTSSGTSTSGTSTSSTSTTSSGGSRPTTSTTGSSTSSGSTSPGGTRPATTTQPTEGGGLRRPGGLGARPSGPQVTTAGAEKVVLIGGGKRYILPGQVPPGSYDIEATFAGQKATVVGKVKVTNTGAHVACNERMGICRSR